MEIPLISKKQFNRFKKFLPVSINAEKISARIVINCANWVIRNGRSWKEILKNMENLILFADVSLAGASLAYAGGSLIHLLQKLEKVIQP